MSLYPKKPHTQDRLWMVRSRALYQLTLMVVSCFLLPGICVIWTISNIDHQSLCFWWLAIAFINTVFLDVIVGKKIAFHLYWKATEPKFPINLAMEKKPSYAIENEPTRKLYLRQDIYCFCWTLCLSQDQIRAQGLTEPNE